MVKPYIFQILLNEWIQFKSYQFCVESAEETCNILHTVKCRKGESAPVAFSIKRCVTPLLFLGWPIVLSFLTLLAKNSLPPPTPIPVSGPLKVDAIKFPLDAVLSYGLLSCLWCFMSFIRRN